MHKEKNTRTRKLAALMGVLLSLLLLVSVVPMAAFAEGEATNEGETITETQETIPEPDDDEETLPGDNGEDAANGHEEETEDEAPSFQYDPQPEGPIVIDEEALESGSIVLPRWEFAPDAAFLPEGWLLVYLQDEETGAWYYTLQQVEQTGEEEPVMMQADLLLTDPTTVAAINTEIANGIATGEDVDIEFDASNVGDTLTFASAINIAGAANGVTITFRATNGPVTILNTTTSHMNITATGGVTVAFDGVTLNGGYDTNIAWVDTYTGCGGITATNADVTLVTPDVRNCVRPFSGNINIDTVGAGLEVNGGSVTINGGTFDSCASSQRGAIDAENATLTLNGVTITNNYNNNSTGGGLRAYNTTLVMDGCIVTGNDANSGGGVYAAGTQSATINGGSISNNTTRINSGHGGGLYLDNDGLSTITGTLIEGNVTAGTSSPRGYGAGIYFQNSTAQLNLLTLNNVTLRNNTSPTQGGGLFSANGNVVINGGSFSGNNASTGAGLYFARNNGSTPLLTTTNVTFSGNNATSQGAGIYMSGSGISANIKGGSFSGNSCNSMGGAIYSSASVVTIEDVRFESNSSGTGGAVTASTKAEPYNLHITNSVFYGNSATNGGALSVTGNAIAILEDSTIGGTGAGEGNTATNGGGIFTGTSTSFNYLETLLTLKNTTVQGNTATLGGGIFSKAIVQLTEGTAVIDNTATGNSTAHGSGGGVHMEGMLDGSSTMLENLARLTVDATVTLAGNTSAASLYKLNTADQALYEAQVSATGPFSEGTEHAWNNRDINYNRGTELKSITITYYTALAGGSANLYTTQTVLSNTTFEAPDPEPTQAGKVFKGWYRRTGNAFTGYKYGTQWGFETDTTASNLSLYAYWEDAAVTVTFRYNYLAGEEDIYTTDDITWNTAVTPPAIPGREGHTFAEWYTSEDCLAGEEYNFTTLLQDDITLYAKWTVNQYTITYVADGATAPPPETLDYGTPPTEPADPNKEGHEFIGWYGYPTSADRWIFSSETLQPTTMPAQDVTLTARYTTNTYYAYFYNQGALHASQPTLYGNKVTQPTTVPTRAGYTFTGWQLRGGSWNFASDTMGAGHLYFDATWKVNATGSSSEAPASSSSEVTPPPAGSSSSSSSSSAVRSASSSSVASASASGSSAAAVSSDASLPASSTAVSEPPPVISVPEETGESGSLLASIGDSLAPLIGLFSTANHWSMLNLVLTILMLALSVMMLVREAGKNKRPNTGRLFKVLAVVLGILSLPIFLLTQDLRQPMGIADIWSVFMAVLLAAQLVFWTVHRKRRRDAIFNGRE